jgi:excisionase family DNA binding protein
MTRTQVRPPGIDPATGSKLLGPREAAAYLGVSRQTLYGYVRNKRVNIVRSGRWLRFRHDDLERLRERGIMPEGEGTVTEYDPAPPSGLSPQQLADVKLLRRAIHRSGLSARQFARQVLVRDERTVRRWLAGEYPLPDMVTAKLRELVV